MTSAASATTGASARDVGARLRARRVAAGLTQQQLAHRARLSVRTVQGLETGEFVRPRRDTLRRLDEALRAVGASNRAGVVRTYAEPVPTDAAGTGQNRAEQLRNVTLSGLPDNYARPARLLSTAPARDALPLVWLEVTTPATVVTPHGTVSEARVNLCRAIPHEPLRPGTPRAWRTHVMAPGLRPLDGVELVDALRSLRGGR